MCFHIVRGVFYLFAELTILFICNSNDTKPRETVKTSPATFQNPYDFNENELEKNFLQNLHAHPFCLSCGLINFQFDKTKLPLMRERMLICIIGWFSFPKNYLSFFLSRIAIASFDIGTRMMRFIIVIRPIPTSPRSQTTVYSCKPPIKSITSAIIL